jgi:hypothetical protein
MPVPPAASARVADREAIAEHHLAATVPPRPEPRSLTQEETVSDTTTTTTATASAVTRLTRAEAQECFEELRRRIVTGTDEDMVNYVSELASLAANARKVGMFRKWSSRNYMFIESQRRRFGENHIGLYAGTAQWRKLARVPRDTARPKKMWAFVPPAAIRDEGLTPEELRAANAAHRSRPAFRLVEVFDWSDTVSTDTDFVEPNWAAPLATGDNKTLDRLVSSSPVPVQFLNLGGATANGYLDATGITVNSDLPVGNRISTLAHELVHHQLGHLAVLGNTAEQGEQDEVRARCEQEAALGQWLVMKMLGLGEEVGNDITTQAANYLRTWSDPDSGEEIAGHKRRGKLLDARLDAALAAADAIVERFCLTP